MVSRTVAAGGYGKANLEPGWFLYAGRSRRGWASRLKRFTNRERRCFWHIDYVVRSAGGIDLVIPVEGNPEEECGLAADLVEAGEGVPLPGFGNSDCSPACGTHGVTGTVQPATLAGRLRTAGWDVVGYFLRQEGRFRWFQG